MKTINTFLCLILLTGCVPASRKMTRISLGMTKDEVISEVGNPISISAKGETEYLNYRLPERSGGWPVPYFVRLINGKVESFGRSGDFDSTKDPKLNLSIENK